MTAVQPAPHKLYEYRGNRRDVTGPAESEHPLYREPVTHCTACLGAVEKVVGGWWCESCQTAVS